MLSRKPHPELIEETLKTHLKEPVTYGDEFADMVLQEKFSPTGSEQEKWNHMLASCIDHTILKPDASAEQVRDLCMEAAKYGFASVCVNPGFVELCAMELAHSPVPVCTVIGFPLGATTTKQKVFEVNDSAENGASEFDMVINLGFLKSGLYADLENEIGLIVDAAKSSAPTNIVKVIIETCFLTDEEKVIACLLAKNSGADFVKTSTGFGPAGATIADISLMRGTVGNDTGVKASGGIRTFDVAIEMLRHGARRIGTSSGVALIHS